MQDTLHQEAVVRGQQSKRVSKEGGMAFQKEGVASHMVGEEGKTQQVEVEGMKCHLLNTQDPVVWSVECWFLHLQLCSHSA